MEQLLSLEIHPESADRQQRPPCLLLAIPPKQKEKVPSFPFLLCYCFVPESNPATSQNTSPPSAGPSALAALAHRSRAGALTPSKLRTYSKKLLTLVHAHPATPAAVFPGTPSRAAAAVAYPGILCVVVETTQIPKCLHQGVVSTPLPLTLSL